MLAPVDFYDGVKKPLSVTGADVPLKKGWGSARS
jgi:hypothetical protein